MKTLLDLSSQVLGKYFLSIESLRFIPAELVEKIFDEFCRTISSSDLMNETDLSKIVTILTDEHSDLFCTSFCYYRTNSLNLLSNQFYLHLLQRMESQLIQLDFSNVLSQWSYEDKKQLLNLIGQMESLEYLKLTYNQLDDDDIRFLTANHRIRTKALCNLQQLHLQGKREKGIQSKTYATFSRQSSHVSSSSVSEGANIFRDTLCVLRLTPCKSLFTLNKQNTSLFLSIRIKHYLRENSITSTNALVQRRRVAKK